MVGALLMITGATVLGSVGLYQLEVLHEPRWAVSAPQRKRWRASRRTLSLIGGTLVAAGILSLIPATGQIGSGRTFFIMLAITAWIGIALVIPRQPQLREERRRKAIRLALPAAVTQWKIAIEAGEKLVPIMERYASVPRAERSALQDVIQQARADIEAGKTRTFTDPTTGQTLTERMLFSDALLAAAQTTACQELISIVTILANADQSGGLRTALPALTRSSEMLDTVIRHEIDELITKRSLKLIAAAAPAVVGAVLLLIFVAAAGSNIPL